MIVFNISLHNAMSVNAHSGRMMFSGNYWICSSTDYKNVNEAEMNEKYECDSLHFNLLAYLKIILINFY